MLLYIIFEIIIIIFNSLIIMKITEKTRLNVINSRFGSRLTLNLNFSEHSAETGNLGIDVNTKKKAHYQKQQLKQLRFYLKCGTSDYEGFYFSKLNSYLGGQELILGLTSIKMIGMHSSQLEVELTIRSPISLPKEVEDDDLMKILTTPSFLIETRVKNLASFSQKTELYLGLNLEEHEAKEQDIIFIDNGKGSIGKKEKYLALRCLNMENVSYQKDLEDNFKGFKREQEIAPNQQLEYKYIYAGFDDDVVFVDELNEHKKYNLSFYYTKWYPSILQVLDDVEKNYNKIIQESDRFERALKIKDQDEEKKDLMILAFRNYVANTWFLDSEKGPKFYVWGGGFGMISSLPVSMEVEIMAKLFPWTLKLQLSEWKKYLTTEKKSGLLYLKHDMGYDQQVGFSYHEDSKKVKEPTMPVEQNADFIILLYWYYHITKDKRFIEDLNLQAFRLMMANKKRGYRKSGIANTDNYTVYNASNMLYNCSLNTYLAIKECVAYIMARELCLLLGEKENAELIQEEIEKIHDSLTYYFKKYEFLPISLDEKIKGGQQHSIATSDPLFYVLMTSLKDPVIDDVIEFLKKDFEYTYSKSKYVYGMRLVENEEICWYSKIAIIEAVANKFYNISVDSYKYAYDYNIDNPRGYSDGTYSEKKEWLSWYYPRGVAFLWELIHEFRP